MDNKKIFCAAEQKNTNHSLVLDHNEEIVARCVDCGSFLKFPNVPDKDLDDLIALNEEANKGQVIVESTPAPEEVGEAPEGTGKEPEIEE